jgi:hypothetical protein
MRREQARWIADVWERRRRQPRLRGGISLAEAMERTRLAAWMGDQLGVLAVNYVLTLTADTS